jgi:hypothetical protein
MNNIEAMNKAQSHARVMIGSGPQQQLLRRACAGLALSALQFERAPRSAHTRRAQKPDGV